MQIRNNRSKSWDYGHKHNFYPDTEEKDIKKILSILKVSVKKNKNRVLECLAIKCNEISSNNYEIRIFFAGGSVITLISEFIEVVMHDLGKSWTAKRVPKHKI